MKSEFRKYLRSFLYKPKRYTSRKNHKPLKGQRRLFDNLIEQGSKKNARKSK